VVAKPGLRIIHAGAGRIPQVGAKGGAGPLPHIAPAQAVASNTADAGLGIEAAAREKGLGFVPLVQERFHLVCLKSALRSPPVAALLTALKSTEWQTTLQQLPGYSGEGAQSGQVLALRQVLPWWSYRQAKK
jgi:putative molybdopterin biosynthesis protein